MALLPDDPTPPPRSLKPEDNPVPGGNPEPGGDSLPENPRPSYVPTSKEEAEARADTLAGYFSKYQKTMLKNDLGFKVVGGVVYRRADGADTSYADKLRATGEYSESDIALLESQQAQSGSSEKWEQDTQGQLLYNEWQDAIADVKSLKSNLGNVRSYLDTESDKTSEITRQFKDFANRASVYEDLMADEQAYGLNADKGNAAALKMQQDYGLASSPYYAHRPMDTALSSILRPSLPDYVRPDYRLNAAVGLPGPEGFDDPDYNASGMPFYGKGTKKPTRPPRPWIWGAR